LKRFLAALLVFSLGIFSILLAKTALVQSDHPQLARLIANIWENWNKAFRFFQTLLKSQQNGRNIPTVATA
jgi:hypothetical protein